MDFTPMPPPLIASPIDRLRAARAVLARQNDPDIAAVVAGLDAYLDPHAETSLDAALGLLPVPGAEHWRTDARRFIRDNELRLLAKHFLIGLKTASRARAMAALINRYQTTRWKADCREKDMPPACIGRPEQHLFRAFHAFRRMPSERQLRRILAVSY